MIATQQSLIVSAPAPRAGAFFIVPPFYTISPGMSSSILTLRTEKQKQYGKID
jgi:hypothetical protein